ncbi:MAG: hypothetical protein WBD42_05865, partial [Methylovirgula sp.]
MGSASLLLDMGGVAVPMMVSPQTPTRCDRRAGASAHDDAGDETHWTRNYGAGNGTERSVDRALL